MITDVNLLIEKFNNLEALLFEYAGLTANLSSADIELTEETEAIFEKREKLIEKMKSVTPQIDELIEKQTTEKAVDIRKMFAGQTVLSDFAEDEKAVQAKIITLRSLQSDILSKDSDNKIKFKRKYDEIRIELENLQKDKKKLNFYQNVNAPTDEKIGAKFDNSL